MEETRDSELVRLARSGDSRAFEKLITRHYERMYATAYKWTRNRADAEDVTQNACIKMARSIYDLKKEATFNSWLYRLVLNTARDYQRQAGRIHVRETVNEEEMLTGQSKDSPEKDYYARQVVGEIYTLPEKERDALLLVYSEELSHGEAARVLGIAESTVSWRIHSARKRLQKRLEVKR
jgi:RNA polymerase sigma-70 factor (ECF subfamily)